MQESYLKKVHGLSTIKLTFEFSDRALKDSIAQPSPVDLNNPQFKCSHWDCDGGEIRYSKRLAETIGELKKAGEKKGSFAIMCSGRSKSRSGHKTCGGCYRFFLEID